MFVEGVGTFGAMDQMSPFFPIDAFLFLTSLTYISIPFYSGLLVFFSPRWLANILPPAAEKQNPAELCTVQVFFFWK